jgi:hypothetical protein
MYVIRCRLYFLSQIVCILCFLLQTECILCFLSSSDGQAGVSKLVATVDSNSDSRMTSARPLLVGATVATDRLLVATMTYDLLLQWLFVVVVIS